MNTPAPELQVSQWFNSETPLSLAKLRGRVVLVEAFQMLCPGCVSHGLPLAKRVAGTFSPDEVAVIGLHSVFEHHAAQGTAEAVTAFLHEYQIRFPVAIDAASDSGAVPRTMKLYGLQGTPSLLLIDRQGRLRRQTFGLVQDLVLGAEIASLIAEKGPLSSVGEVGNSPATDTGCTAEGCGL